jgi:PTS system nitrogen regulatory IIA component
MIIQELIQPSYINLNLNAKNKREVMEAMAVMLKKEKAIDDLEGFLQDIYEREAIMSTGIGYGIAIPHAKSSHVKIPSVIFARSDEGIAFDAMDGKDAHLFFMIAMPEDGTNAHLKVLAMLSRKLMHLAFRESLREATSKEEVLKLLYTMD